MRSALAQAVTAALLVIAAAPALAQVPADSVDLRLASDGTGSPTGTLAVRVTYPRNLTDYRYPDGAPVVVYLPGGTGPGNLGAGRALVDPGFVLVTFLFPGGSEGSFSSDGAYDYRGDNCQKALRDVIRFAESAAIDTLGRTLDDIVPGSVHPLILGLAPFSNGLIGLVTLDRYGSAIPWSPYHAGWENPTNAQIINGDLGTNSRDCDASLDGDGNGLAGDDGNNPWYDPATGYGPTSFDLDDSALAWAPLFPGNYTDPAFRCPPASPSGAVLHDGRTNGRVDFKPGQFGCLDYDGDGVIERTEDFRLLGQTTFTSSCLLKVYFSPEVTHALADRSVFPGTWPAWIATVPEADAYWPLRDATVHWEGIASRFPDFRGLTTFTRQDHVQSQGDHPHVRQVRDGFASRGMWLRLNADAAYYQDVNGTLPEGYVETPANASIPMGEMKSRAEPQGTSADTMGSAANAEMADRIHAGCWWNDLTGVLRSPVQPEPDSAELTIGADRKTISWTAASGAFCYDLLRGDVGALSDDGSRVLLGNASCVTEDSAGLTAEDETLPFPGKSFYYVVKPNGLHGTYGASSSGHTRSDARGACRD